MATAKQIDEFIVKEELTCLTIDGEEQEAYFSWRGCDICNDGLGNNVYDCSGFHPSSGSIVTGYQVCGGCLCYIYNGDTEQLDN